MNNGLIFGAGGIGRGLAGQIFVESGLKTVFVDVDRGVVDRLNALKGYAVTAIANEAQQTTPLRGVSALHAGDTEAVEQEVAGADVIATAVGSENLKSVAEVIARGLKRRFTTNNVAPLDILICENLMDAPAVMRAYVEQTGLLTPAQLDRVGFVDTSIGRMVPLLTPAMRQKDPLHLYAEPYCRLQIDKDGVKGCAAALKNVEAVSPFSYQKECKLFIHNMGHSAASYWGYLYGREYIWQCMEHAQIKGRVKNAMESVARALIKAYGADGSELNGYVEELLERFYNIPLMDTVARGCRDPLRKLLPHDRFIGAYHRCESQHIDGSGILETVAAAMRYGDESDPGVFAMRQLTDQLGVPGFLKTHCGLSEDAAEACRLYYERLRPRNGR